MTESNGPNESTDPADVEPTPVEPAPVEPEPAPVEPEPAPVEPEPAPVEPTASESRLSEPATTPSESGPTPAIGLGIALLLIGVVLFIGQLFDIGLEDFGWPAIIIGVGLVILVLGVVVNRERGMVIGGTVVTTVGLVLLYQNSTGHWESWAYAWALVGPAASGLGLLLWGIRIGDPTEIRNGTWALLGGLGLFVIGFLFFEGVIGIGGRQLPIPEWLLPVVVIGIGIVLLARGIFERRTAESA